MTIVVTLCVRGTRRWSGTFVLGTLVVDEEVRATR